MRSPRGWPTRRRWCSFANARDPRAAARTAAQAQAHQPAQRLSAYRHRYLHAARHLVSSSQHPGTPSYATAEMTWGLILAAMRQIPQQMASLKAGNWQIGVGTTLRGKTLGIYGYGRIGGVVAGYGRAFGMNVLVWARPATLRRRAPTATRRRRAKKRSSPNATSSRCTCGWSQATRHIVTAADLARMKPTRASGQHQPRAADRAGRAGRGAACAGGPAWPRSTSTSRSRCCDTASVAQHAERRLHAAYRLRHARRIRGAVRRHLRSDQLLCGRQSDQRRQSRRAEGLAAREAENRHRQRQDAARLPLRADRARRDEISIRNFARN